MNRIKTAFIDVETGGLSAYKNPLLQIAGIIDIDGEAVEKFEYKIKPFPSQQIHPKSLEVTGYTHAQINRFDDPKRVFSAVKNIFKKYVDPFDKSDKFYLSGYNTTFDEQFLRQFWKNNADNYFGSFFHFPVLDVAVVAAEYLKPQRHSMSDFKLMTVAEKIFDDIDPTAAHDAIYDIEITRRIYNEIAAKQNRNA